jgi:hypothetical protein
MMTPARLLSGLDAIAQSLSVRPQALALLALGSCGVDKHRLDAFSDLDFFVIVEESAKADFIADLDWLNSGSPRVFAHQNTRDGWKTLDADGVFCEFAVFHSGELAAIPYAPGRVVWCRDGFDTSILAPTPRTPNEDAKWLRREALTNLLIGLKRYLRGEKLAAWRCIGVDAADLACRALKAMGPSKAEADLFNPWRRLELTHGDLARTMETALKSNHEPTVARYLLQMLAHPTDDTSLTDQIQAHLELCDAG